MLARLVDRAGGLVTSAELLGRSRDQPTDATDLAVVTAEIAVLRRVLGVGPDRPSIVSEAPLGYRLVIPERRP